MDVYNTRRKKIGMIHLVQRRHSFICISCSHSFLKNLSEITSVKEQSSSRIHIKRINQSHLATGKGTFRCGEKLCSFCTNRVTTVVGCDWWVSSSHPLSQAASSAVHHYSSWSVISLNVIGESRSVLVFLRGYSKTLHSYGYQLMNFGVARCQKLQNGYY